MTAPKFSIIIPTYNRRKLLQNTIESVLAQTHTDYELIIVDDGSTDDTKEYVESIEDSRIKLIVQENKGECAARNTGLSYATGAWICYVDSDDLIDSNYLNTFDLLIDAKHLLYCSGVRLSWPAKNKHITYTPSLNYSKFIEQYLIGHFNLMPFCFHHTIAKSKQFEEGIIYVGDFPYLLPLLMNNKCKISQETTSTVMSHQGRIVNRIYDTPIFGYQQMQHTITDVIISNKTKLLNYISMSTYENVLYKKRKDFILGVSDIHLLSAISLMKKENLLSIDLLIRCIIQRCKGAIKAILSIN